MSNFVTLPHLTPKEKAFFAPSNHERVTELVKAGNCINCLKNIPPVYLNLDITWRCNFDCVGCIDGGVVGREEITKGTNLDMDWEVARDLLEYAKRYSLLGFIVQGGEPLLYPHIDDLLDTCGKNGFVLRLVTNGSQLINHTNTLIFAFQIPKSVIRVSINADDTHYREFTRGKVDLSTVVKGIKAVANGGASICVGTVVFGKNFTAHRIPPNVTGARQVCRWIFQAAKGCCDHNFSHLLFSQVTRKANVADAPARLHIMPDCFKRFPTTCLHAPSTSPEPMS